VDDDVGCGAEPLWCVDLHRQKLRPRQRVSNVTLVLSFRHLHHKRLTVNCLG
jgi:hypothetical protein